MKGKSGIALLLGAPEGDDESGSDMSMAAEMAVKAFFRAGSKGNWSKAVEALKEAMDACDEYDTGDESEPEDDDEDEGSMM